MLTLKLQKRSSSSKKRLIYDIVVMSEFLKPNSGKFIEKIGYYMPLKNNWHNKSLYIDCNRLYFWISRGVVLDSNLYLIIKPLIIYNFIKK